MESTSTEFEGGRITSDLALWPHEEIPDHWEIKNGEDYVQATGSSGEMIELALMIPQNIPDRRDLPPLDHLMAVQTAEHAHDDMPYDPGDLAIAGENLVALGLDWLAGAREEARRKGLTEQYGVRFDWRGVQMPFRLEFQDSRAKPGDPGS